MRPFCVVPLMACIRNAVQAKMSARAAQPPLAIVIAYIEGVWDVSKESGKTYRVSAELIQAEAEPERASKRLKH